MRAVILGCGYTGTRVAERLLARGHEVIATTRHPEALRHLEQQGVRVVSFNLENNPDTGFVPAGAHVLYSIPQASSALIRSLGDRPARVVHISTTGVYGRVREVDHLTQPEPHEEREIERYRQEELIASGPWATLVLRAAAIYGPGRGIHVSMARGEFRLAGDGSNYVSRIHVDDLAALAEAALSSGVTGAYPVADAEPCQSREIALFCSQLLSLPMPETAPEAELHGSRRADRRVDGSEIGRLLSVDLLYRSFRTGIPAANYLTHKPC